MSSVDTTTSTSNVTATPSTVERTDSGGSLGQDAFLKLLVAQMQNQDPASPTDSGQMMSQLASFSQVSQLQTLTASQQALTLSQDFSSAVSLIGKNVTYTNAKGDQVTGAVAGVKTDTDRRAAADRQDSVHTGAIVSVQ